MNLIAMSTPSETPLSALCTICYTNTPKYTCPRCSVRTCSLPCTTRHKKRADCNGVRDPTKYMPKRELVTPRGVDHDYNFLSSIERNVQRTDRKIVEELGLVNRTELFGGQRGRGGGGGRGWGRGSGFRSNRGGKGRFGDMQVLSPLERAYEKIGVMVDSAPKGMQRQVENGTRWSKIEGCLNWTVEAFTSSDSSSDANAMPSPRKRILLKCLDRYSVAKAWGEMLLAEGRKGLTKPQRKRVREEAEQGRRAKKSRVENLQSGYSAPMLSETVMQNPMSSCWNFEGDHIEDAAAFDDDAAWKAEVEGLYFYLLRPNTPAGKPKVLCPIPRDETLAGTLAGKSVLEFPTIYVLGVGPETLADGGEFMTEDAFLSRKGITLSHVKGMLEPRIDDDDDEDEGSSDDEESSEGSGGSGDEAGAGVENMEADTSSSDGASDDSDEEMEDGEA